MSYRSLRLLALLGAGLFASACQEGSPTTPAEADLNLQAALSAAGDAAVQSGDLDRAEALRHGATALRWGIRPSRIEVKIKNETQTYLALVVGIIRRRGGAEPVLVRTLVAWTGRPPTALLQVTSKSDQALFGPPDGGNGNGGPDAARGHWKDLVNHELWVATAGSADLELASTGAGCPVRPDAALRCVLAWFDLRINGSFQLVGNAGPDGGGAPIEIHTEADGVNGVVIKPAE
ncbi:MAG TPA: hypothetical protein VGQ69_00435 [Gemmatimonadales bacterium]|jgi:hypothetical protein|nr:hypothetical protein [Gemmatimonadales bacterium]